MMVFVMGPMRFLSFLLIGFPSLLVRAQIPDQVVVEGVPEASAALRAEVARYLEFRTATFQDWHPKRRDILLTTRFADTVQLHRIELPLGARRQLTFLPEPVAGGSFQPADESRIVFAQDQGGGEFFQLYGLNLEDGRVSLLTDGRSRNTGPVWSRRGDRLAYASTRRNGRDTDLYVMDPAQPASDRRLADFSGSGWVVLDWSPDDRQLLALSYVSINESYLHLVDLASGTRQLLTPVTGTKVSYSGGRFLPGGRSAIVAADRDSEHRRLIRLDLETGAVEPVGPEIPWDVETFDLSADGRHLAVFTNQDGASVLRVIDLRNRRERRLPTLPAGVASGLKWHASRPELAFSLSSARSPSDVYSVDLRTASLTRWTESESGGLSPGRFAEPELVRVRSFDGLALSGFLYRPDARRFPGPRPVLVIIHGGPESQSRPVFQARWNYLLEELGVAVLYPNVRGSSGYGKTFLTLDNGLRREDSVKDIGAFLDWVSARPELDAARVGVYGGSYGGYMVLASLVHHGSRLRCGIDVVGISSFPTFLRNTQDYRRDLRRVEYGDERDPTLAEFLHRISPLTNADRIAKPLLVVQGRNDPRVPVTEAEQMVAAIRGGGGQVWYLMAKDEGHGFQKKRNSDFMFLTIVQFLQQHLLN